MAILKYFCNLRVLVILLILLRTNAAIANEDLQLYEQQIKAGLLYNFLKYTNWPEGSMAQDNKINLCIFGDDPFGGYLLPMQGRSVNRREISIRNIHSVNDADNCQMLFVNIDEKSGWPTLRKYLSGKNILTVSDISGFTASGGMIGFTRKDDRVNVVLNQEAVNAAKLSVQDRLLKLVTVVHNSKKGG